MFSLDMTQLRRIDAFFKETNGGKAPLVLNKGVDSKRKIFASGANSFLLE